ncbi:MAG: sulfatase [Mariniblastus sp.]|nr:sulfatase [Mariniblastus sp.]
MQFKITLTVYLTALFAFVFVHSASAEQKPPNVLLICVDDLRPELGCFGVDYINSPNIDEFASNGTVFHRHYVQAPTCGASRYTLLTGTYGGSNNAALFTRAGLVEKNNKAVTPSMPAWFRKHGYTTVSVGKVSHHPGGWGGDRWNDPEVLEMPEAWDRHLLPSGAWQDPRGWMHGLANGEIRDDSRTKSGGISMDVFQAVDGGDEIYPDGVSVDEALRQMDNLAADSDAPFFLAVGILRPHLPFGAPAKYLQPYDSVTLPVIPHPKKPNRKTTWHRSGEFMKYNRWQRNPNTDSEFANEVRKHYAACVSYADAQVGRLIDRLEKTGSADNTIVVLWGDHGWHLGEHAIWGKHSLFEESLRSPLIISAPALEQHGAATKSIVETLDLFPTLCDLTGLETPKSIQGVSLTPILRDPNWNGRPAISYFKKAKTIRTESHRLILHDDGFVELYDHRTPEKETVNIAATEPKLVAQLTKQLKTRLSR